MLPKLHPLAKTAIEARRALQRLKNFVETNSDDPYVKDGAVSVIIADLENIRAHIPKELLDVDKDEG